jgi:DNA-binding CsgD family transcriptional regulator
MPLGRRALYEKKPAVVNSLFEKAETFDSYNWELDWPAILYAPISLIGQRPIGLLTIGCRRDHWYTEQDVAYAHTLGITLAPLVAALRGPLGQLNESEGEVAQLLSYGLSTAEIARAIRADDRQARHLVDDVAKKLQSINPTDLEFPIVQMRKRAFRL